MPWLRWLMTVPERAVRTLRAFVPALAVPDDAFAERILSPEELGLYRLMDRRDRHHACLVAKRVLQEEPDASPELLRAALLHDVGKVGVPYSALQRIAVALYLPKELPLEPRLTGWRGAYQVGRHHDSYGARMILAAGGSARVAEIVARHHRPEDDADAASLKRVDEGF